MSSTSKRYALLLEAVIGLSLTAMLLTALLGIYRRVQTVDEPMAPVWEECALHLHLRHILSNITCILSIDDDLVCTFDNGIDHDPHFCSEVLARVYRDSAGRFIAAIWPSPKLWKLDSPPYRQIVLATDVEEVTWTKHGPMIEVALDDHSLLFPIYSTRAHPICKP